MPQLYTAIEINAPRPWVWQALLRKEQWQRWNTFLYDCDPARPFHQGREVSLALCRLEGDEFTDFDPVITRLEPDRCLRWLAQMPGFKSEQAFELLDLGPNRTQYIHRERFSGLLSRAFLPFIRQDERQGLQRMARQLKRYTERQVYDDHRRRRWGQGQSTIDPRSPRSRDLDRRDRYPGREQP
ncbi:MAG: SRPBCC domain-containing protein [Leptolyngbya sp.]|nr:SRPBCC domain-containing protein [Leptolyngbya sp.]